MRAHVATILDGLNNEQWLSPAISYETHEISAVDEDWVELGARTRLESSPLLGHRMRHAKYLAVGVCTLGGRVSELFNDWFAEARKLQAVILDTVATLALYQLAERCEQSIAAQATTMELKASGSLSPGEEGFDLRQQHRIVELARGGDIDVTVQGAATLVPRMSLTLVVGLGARMAHWTRGESCSRCKARDRCPFRSTEQESMTAGAAT